MKLPHNITGLFCLFAVVFSPLLTAQEVVPEPVATAPVAAPVTVSSTLASARATMTTFLHSMNDIKRGEPDRIDDAITTLDLSDINTIVRRERGEDLAWMLLEVLDRTRIIELETIPDSATGKPYVVADYFLGKVTLSRVSDGRWLFDRETVAKLPEILDKLADQRRLKGSDQDKIYLPLHIRLRQSMPENLKQSALLLENWQWIGLFLIVLMGVVLDKLLSMLLRAVIRQWKKHTKHIEYRNLSDQMLRPLGLMAMAVLWWLGINLLGLPENALLVLLVAVKFLASISGVWVAYRLVDLVGLRLVAYAAATENKLDDALMPLIPRVLKVFVTVIGIVFIADNLNMDVSSLLAGLGLGGLAFALAAKDLVQNLFGSVTVLLDRTFTVGDWVIVGDVEGSVEQIGFRSTRIRTFYNSVVTVPNSKFITAEVDNMGERRFRRLSCKLSLTYDTQPDRIEAFCEGVRELIRLHPYMRKDYYHVYLNEFAASSLDILLYVFWMTPEWNTELRERHRFLLDILRLAKRLGVEFAYPTQTLFMKPDPTDAAADPVAELSASEAEEQGRGLARAIIDETLGRDVKPPPVRFPRVE